MNPNKVQKDLDILLSIINDSSMSAKQKNLCNEKVQSLVAYSTEQECLVTKLRANRHGFDTDQKFIDYCDRLVGLCNILGIEEVEINMFNEEMYHFIIKNRDKLKRPIHFANINLLLHCLSLYQIFNKKMPETMNELAVWLKENDYSERLEKWDLIIKESINKVNAEV